MSSVISAEAELYLIPSVNDVCTIVPASSSSSSIFNMCSYPRMQGPVPKVLGLQSRQWSGLGHQLYMEQP